MNQRDSPSPQDSDPRRPIAGAILMPLACLWALLLAFGLTTLLAQTDGWPFAALHPSPTSDRTALPPQAGGQPKAFPCLSYAPFRRRGHTPMDPGLTLTDAQLREDLAILSRWTSCIRTYGMGHGQHRIPGIAAEFGMQVVLGVWVDRDRANTQRELQAALAAAAADPVTVRMIVVGNEVLLRQELSPKELAQLLRQARQQAAVPVAYADVWEFWLRHAPVLAPVVDVAAIHVLPYWEDEPQELASAVDHVVSTVGRVQQSLGERAVWLAETGWPAVGRQRGPAVPGPREQALFVQRLQERMSALTLDYNLIEAFDQPWKRQLEGAMGGAWGLLNADAQPRNATWGRLPSDPRAQAALVGLLAGLLAGAGLAWLGCGRGTARSPTGTGLALCCSASAGLSLGWHAGDLTHWLRSAVEWALAGTAFLTALAVTLQSMARCVAPMRPHSVSHTIALRLLLFVLGMQALALVFDGRYRPLPAGLVAAPALALLAVRVLGLRLPVFREDRLLAAVVLLCAPALLFLEGPANRQAWLLGLAWVALAAAVLWGGADQRLFPPRQDGLADRPSSMQHSAEAAQRSAS